MSFRQSPLPRLAVALLLMVVASPIRSADSNGNAAQAVQQILTTQSDHIDFASAKLQLDRLVDPSIDVSATSRELDRMTLAMARMAGPQANAQRKVSVIRTFLYARGPWNGNHPFRYDHGDPLGTHLPNKLLPRYLATRLGNCVSMPILFLILADRLGVNATLSTAPLHVMVRFTDEAGRVRNLEATNGGSPSRDAWYRQIAPMSDRAVESGIYLQSLSRKEAVAVMANTVVVHLVNHRRYEEAIAVADVILEHYPRDIHTMLARANAYGLLLSVEFEKKYPALNSIPTHLRPRYALLSRRNQAAFENAESLGWKPE